MTDTGHGMDAATKARICEPFFSTKQRGHGLAGVLGIVRAPHGVLRVTSTVGEGTTFTIWLQTVAESDGA